LPCTGQLERADVTFFMDQFLPEVAAQYSPRVLEPAAERWPAWRIFAALGERLGLDVLPAGVDAATITEDDLLAPIVDRGRRPFSELQAAGVLVDEPASFGWVERSLPDGRWRVAPEPLVAQLADLIGRDDMAPLVLVPRRQLRHLNSAMRDLVAPGGRVDEPDVLLHPLDASDADVGDGDTVTVTSEHGVFTARARVSDEVRRGAVSVTHGWNGAAAVGRLTSAHVDCDPLTGMPLQSGVPVTVAPATN
jgi:anaerobic selenocysteine-containing dehydrogenase